MTFWKRRNVVLCFIIFYRRFLLSIFRILFNWIVTLVSRPFYNSLSLDGYTNISRTFRFLFYWIVTFVFGAPIEFSSIGTLHQYPAHFCESLSLDCYASVSRALRILFHWTFTIISCALLEPSFFIFLR